MNGARDLDDHNLYFHTVEDLLHRYRDESDPERRAGVQQILAAVLAQADRLGLTTDEVGGVRASCCREFLDTREMRP